VSLGLITKESDVKEKALATPAPGGYDVEKSIKGTEKHVPAAKINMSAARRTLFEMVAKRTQKQPNMCSYKLKDEVFNRLSKSPFSPKRH
jgi:hypothetical protein